MAHNLNLNWLRTFEAAARHLSFTCASAELGLSQTAVSLQIKSLETKLGQPLFVRGAKSLSLSSHGKAYLPSVREALCSIELATGGLFAQPASRRLTVRASVAMVAWMAPRLGEFYSRHPDIQLQFISALWPDGATQQKVDVDIQLASLNNASHLREQICSESLVAICGPQTAQKVQHFEQLLALPKVDISGYQAHWQHYLGQLRCVSEAPAQYQVDTFAAAAELVASDLGWAVVIERFANSSIAAGRPLVRCGPSIAHLQSHCFALDLEHPQPSPQAQAFKHWLREQMTSS